MDLGPHPSFWPRLGQPSGRGRLRPWSARVERESMELHAGPERLRRIAEVAEELLAVDIRLSRH